MKKNKILYALLILTMIISISNISYGEIMDIEKHWAREDIVYLMEKGVMGGYNDGTFRPDKDITRAEFLKMVNNVFGFTKESDIAFRDVKEDSWFYEDVKKAVAFGYIEGYEDGTMRPNRPITREEASKIIAIASGLDDQILDLAPSFKDMDKIGNWAVKYVSIMKDKGYVIGYEDGTFRPKRQITRGEATKILANINRDMEEAPEEPVKEVSKDEEFIKLINELPHPNEITQIIATDKVKVEKAREIYLSLTDEEKTNISEEVLDKFLKVESKIESLKTVIKSKPKATIAQGQVWAIKKGAHKRFIDIAPIYWEYGELTGINPEILYVQAAKETNFGRYTGQVKPEMNNWAGIKILEPIGDRPEDHETFIAPEDGVRAHFNHMGIYCGVDPIGEPHSRWYKTSTAKWAGKVQYVEDLGGRWAPNPDYGISIMRDYINHMYKTPAQSEMNLHKTLELSGKVDELSEDNIEKISEIIHEYDNLTDSQKDLVPYNIKEKIEVLGTVLSD